MFRHLLNIYLDLLPYFIFISLSFSFCIGITSLKEIPKYLYQFKMFIFFIYLLNGLLIGLFYPISFFLIIIQILSKYNYNIPL